MIYSCAIPPELRERRAWVCWQLETRNGKLTKVPYDTYGRHARVDDPSTWTTFDEVIEDGRPIGYVFSADDPFTGIDLDKCRDPATGATERWALDIVNQLASYTELSPSGTGAHIIVKATLTGPHHRKDGVEIYDRKRFFTITGAKIDGTPSTIEDRQAEVDALVKRIWPEGEGYRRDDPPCPSAVSLSDDALQLALITGCHALTFTDLFFWGNMSRYQGDCSRALAALATIIAKETRDPAQIDRLIRESALFKVSEGRRQKWDAPRGMGTWGSQLIDQALAWTANQGRTGIA
jgi:putative DNA primase/helicase